MLNAVSSRHWSRAIQPYLGGGRIRADASVRGWKRVEAVEVRMEGARAGWVKS